MNAFAISSILIAVTNIFLAIFILWKSKDRHIKYIWSTLCFFIVMWGIGGYKISTITSKEEAILWWQITYMGGPVLIPVLYYHFIYIFLQIKQKLAKYILITAYALGLFFIAVNLFFPENFTGDLKLAFNHIWVAKSFSNPIYFIWYLSFYWILLAYAFWQLIASYKNSKGLFRGQLKYFILGSIVGYLGPHGFFLLVWDINLYPYTNFFIAVYPFIFTYAILKYHIMDINIIVKKAFFYSIIIALISGLITAISFLNSWLADNIPGFKLWVAPLLIGAVTFIIGRLFWNKSKEVEKLKYEFITVAAHKLRTPLTDIKWAASSMRDPKISEREKDKLLKEIVSANERLIDLTNELLAVSRAEANQYQYNFETVNFERVVRKIVNDFQMQMKEKGVKLKYNVEKNLPEVRIDKLRISSVVQTLIENAVLYTKDEIKINIDVYKNSIIFHIEDNGIGIDKEDQPYIFSKFYRTHEAYLTETEGAGIGLFLAKSIIEKHNGKIGLRSEGKDKGSIFWFSLPIA